MTGFVVFFSGSAVCGVVILLGAIRARYVHLRPAGEVRRETTVLGGSLLAYVLVCGLLGYGLLPQLLGCLAGGAVLWFGRSWIPMLAERGRHDAEA